jgi:hypothetical protein
MYLSPAAPNQLNIGAKRLKGIIATYKQRFAADAKGSPPEWNEMIDWLVPAYDVRWLFDYRRMC